MDRDEVIKYITKVGKAAGADESIIEMAQDLSFQGTFLQPEKGKQAIERYYERKMGHKYEERD